MIGGGLAIPGHFRVAGRSPLVTTTLKGIAMTDRSVDRAVEKFARSQHGAFNRHEVFEAGGTDDMIKYRLDSGTWLQLDPAVYALPGNPPTWHRALMAAVLSVPEGHISGRAAAALHGFEGFRQGRAEITIPRGSNHRSRLAVVHQSDLVQVTRFLGIPVSTTAQTFFEVAGRTSWPRLTAAFDLALGTGLVDFDQFAARYVTLRRSRLPGIAKIRALLDTRGREGYVPPSSELERLLWGVLDDTRLPQVMLQASFPWRPSSPQKVDALIPDWDLIVEADGRLWHTRVDDFDRDHLRDNEAAAHGMRVQRFGWVDLKHHADDVLDLILRAGSAGRSGNDWVFGRAIA